MPAAQPTGLRVARRLSLPLGSCYWSRGNGHPRGRQLRTSGGARRVPLSLLLAICTLLGEPRRQGVEGDVSTVV